MATFCRLIDWLQKHVNVLTKICMQPRRRNTKSASQLARSNARGRQLHRTTVDKTTRCAFKIEFPYMGLYHALKQASKQVTPLMAALMKVVQASGSVGSFCSSSSSSSESSDTMATASSYSKSLSSSASAAAAAVSSEKYS